MEYFFRRASGDSIIQRIKKQQSRHCRRSNVFICTTITASLPFIAVDLNLTPKQMSIFIKGLKYILPCQSDYSLRKSIDDILTEQYKSISTSVKQCLYDNRMLSTDTGSKQAFFELEHIIKQLKLKKIPKTLARRAQREYKTVQSILRLLRQRSDVIISRVDKNKVLYIGNAATMVAKAHEYMSKTAAYQEITTGQSPLADNLRAVQTLLDYIVKTQGLTEKQSRTLRPKLDKLELAHYHGLPKTHKVNGFSSISYTSKKLNFLLRLLHFLKVGIPLRSIIACIHAPGTLISKFLNHLLAPIYLQVARETTFINDIDVVRQLENYVINGSLKSTTKFITADVKDLYTMIPRDGTIHALIRFLEKYSYHGKIGTLNIDHILKMARLILDTNYFVYNNKYYRQIRGGAMGSAFTQVLANIYMLEWEQDLIKHQKLYHEIYGR
jgi:hypothetical protein